MNGGTTTDAGLVSAKAIALDESTAGRRRCIERLVGLAERTGRVADRGSAVGAVLEREAEAPTGTGEGVALPHARTDGVSEPVLSFVRLRDGVDFGGPADPDLVFLLLVTAGDDDAHLAAMSRLARGLLDETVRTRLRTVETPGAAAGILREVMG